MILVLVGCNESEDAPPPIDVTKPSDAAKPSDVTTPPAIDNIITSPELVEELRKQPTIDAQFSVLYDNFGHLLDRSNSLTGLDENNNGIRDDIDAFINLLEVSEPVRNVLRQDAKQTQENLYYDFTEKNDANVIKAYGIANKYNKVLACKDFLGIDVDDSINTSNTITALTYNTKARTMAYLTYNHLLDGSVSESLRPEEQYCE